tara:strand:- start:883 stop:1344 length:462 start_codon:yes stop_codon:yes gene_type:complete
MVKYHTFTDRTVRYNIRSSRRYRREKEAEIKKRNEEISSLRRSLVENLNKLKRTMCSHNFMYKNYSDIYNSYNRLLEDYDTLKKGHEHLTSLNNSIYKKNTELYKFNSNLEDKYLSKLDEYNELKETYDELLNEYIDIKIKKEEISNSTSQSI